jgi:hypothetical protein
MTIATIDENKTATQLSQLDQLKKIHRRRSRHGRLPKHQGIQTAGCDDQPELDLCRNTEGAIFSFAR